MLQYLSLAVVAVGLGLGSAWAGDPVQEAREMAIRELKANTVKVKIPGESRSYKVLLTGKNQYANVWMRDSVYGILGLLTLGSDQHETARDTLEFILRYEHPETHRLPQNIDTLHVVPATANFLPSHGATKQLPHEMRFAMALGWFGTEPEDRPNPFGPPFYANYKTENKVEVIDGNLLVPWVASEYVKKTKDLEFARRYFEQAERLVRTIEEAHFETSMGLLSRQDPFSDWADSLKRVGVVGMTNAIYVAALQGLSDWAAELGDLDKAVHWALRSREVRAAFQKHLVWKPEELKRLYEDMEFKDRVAMRDEFGSDENSWTYIKDFVLDPTWPKFRPKGIPVASADVNFFAIAHGVVDPETGRKILNTLRPSKLYFPFPGRAAYPAYPLSMKSPNVVKGQVADYHDEIHWGWISAMAVEAEKAVGDPRRAKNILQQIAYQAVRVDKTFIEAWVKNPKGSDLSSFCALVNDAGAMAGDFIFEIKPYSKSEEQFSWGAGMFLHAYAR